MTSPLKPGNEPDANDMSVEVAPDAIAHKPAATDPLLAEEEEATKLGDFA